MAGLIDRCGSENRRTAAPNLDGGGANSRVCRVTGEVFAAGVGEVGRNKGSAAGQIRVFAVGAGTAGGLKELGAGVTLGDETKSAHVYGCEVGQLGDHPVAKIKYIEVALRIERHTAAAAEAFIGQDVRRGWRSRWDNDHLLAGVKTSTRSQLRQDEKIAGRIKRETGRLSDEKRSRGHRLGGSASVGGYVYAAVAS